MWLNLLKLCYKVPLSGNSPRIRLRAFFARVETRSLATLSVLFGSASQEKVKPTNMVNPEDALMSDGNCFFAMLSLGRNNSHLFEKLFYLMFC